MNLDPAPLLTAAQAGRPRHRTQACPYCENPGVDARCITDVALAAKLGVHPTTITNRWRRGVRVRRSDAEKYATALGLLDHEVWPELLEEAVAEVPWIACAHCATEFIPTRCHQRYCTVACRRSAQYARRPKAVHPEATCAQCGAIFTKHRPDHIVCSKACRQRYDAAKFLEAKRAYAHRRYHTDAAHRAQKIAQQREYDALVAQRKAERKAA